MKFLLCIFILLFQLAISAQTNFEVETDSSVIETKYFKDFNYIGEFNRLKNKKKTYFRKYFYDTKKLQEEGVFGADGYHVGISKVYSQDGRLISEIDYDHGQWTIVDKDQYPFYDLQNRMKILADSLICKMYGQGFLKHHTIWSIDGSYISNEKESGNWEDLLNKKPTEFMFRYHVKVDKDHLYKHLIEFMIDSNGHFIPNTHEAIFGFENVADSLKNRFRLNFDDVMKKAKAEGLSENDTNKAVGTLAWENFKKPELINGQFRFYLTIKTKTIEDIVPHGRSSKTTKYDVYIFNPWTGKFIEKKKMKSIYSWESMSGSGTGLLPDSD